MSTSMLISMALAAGQASKKKPVRKPCKTPERILKALGERELSCRQIAEILKMSVSTVEERLEKMLAKRQVHITRDTPMRFWKKGRAPCQ